MTQLTPKIRSTLSIDFESDWGGRKASGDSAQQGLEEGIPFLVEALNSAGIKATIFVSAHLAKTVPHIIRDLFEQGHEIASHGYDHNLDYSKLSKEEHLYQLSSSIQVLEDITGDKVIGFRSPQFRINPHQFEHLAQLGLKYDSSVVSGRLGKRYDNRNGLVFSDAEAYGIRVFPIPVFPLLGFPMGVLWFNALSFQFSRTLFTHFLKNSSKNQVVGIYCHPFDFVKVKKRYDKSKLGHRMWYTWRQNQARPCFSSLLDLLNQHTVVCSYVNHLDSQSKQTTGYL